MRMGVYTKWLLVSVLLVMATLFAYIRISNVIAEYQRQMQETPEDFSPPPCDHQSCRDKLIRT